MKKESDRFLKLITAYIDGELDDVGIKEVEQLMSETPEYREYYLAESRIKSLIAERVSIVPAPSQLRNRIRRQIARSSSRPSLWQLVQSMFDYRPAATTFAFAIIAFFVFLPTYEMISTGAASLTREPKSGMSAVRQDEIRGEIICLDCDIFAKHEDSLAKHDPVVHRPGLHADDGSIWTILQSPSEKQDHYTRALLKKRAVLRGLVFENSRYIRVNEYKVL